MAASGKPRPPARTKASGKPRPRARTKASGNPRPRGNPNIKDVGFKKGDGRSGRPAGVPNKISRALKDALIYGAEHSRHSADGTLEGFCTALADKFPKAYGPLLTRLLPLTIDARHQIVAKIVYRSVEEIKAAMLERGIPQRTVDLLSGDGAWAPTPIDYSKPRDLVAHPLPADDVKPGRLDDRDDDDDDDDGDGGADLDPQWGPAVASRRM